MSNNPFYPNSVFDNSLKTCSSGACYAKQKNNTPKPKQTFEARTFYPHSHFQPEKKENAPQRNQEQTMHQKNFSQGYSNQINNQNFSPQSYFQQAQQPYDYNAYEQANNNNNFQQNSAPYDYSQAPMQKNMFGSLNPQQLMNMISNKGSFANILTGLGSSNPQLSMLLNLMQNMPKSKKKSQEKKPEEIIIDEDTAKKEAPYKTVKDFYKEN